MDESLPSLLEHQKSTVTFPVREKSKCNKKKRGPWYLPSITCIPIIIIVILIGSSDSGNASDMDTPKCIRRYCFHSK